MPSKDPGRSGGLVPRHHVLAGLREANPLATRIAADLRQLGGGLATRAERDLAACDTPITVVWCEDEPGIQYIFETIWHALDGQHGWRSHPDDQVLFTPFGDEALALVRAHETDLFITDECHPRGPGGRLLLEELSLQPSIALGYVTGCALEACHADGLDLCFQKPFEIAAFLAVLVPLARRIREGTYVAPLERATRIHAGSRVP